MKRLNELARSTLQGLLGDHDLGKILRGASIVLAVQVLSTGLAYLSLILLARWMGPTHFGIYAFAISLTALLAVPSGLGLPMVNVRYIAKYQAAGRLSELRGLLRFSRTATFLSGCALALALFIWVGVLSVPDEPAFGQTIKIAALAVPLFALLALNSDIARGFGRAFLFQGPMQLIRPILVLAGVAGLLVYGISPTAPRVMILAVIAFAIAVGILEIALRSGSGMSALRHVPPATETREWMAVAFPLLIIRLFALISTDADIFFVGVFLEPEDVAHYQAAARTAFLISFILMAINGLAAPRISALYWQGDKDGLQALLSSLIHWVLWPSLALAALIVLFGKFILMIFGPGFEQGYPALVIISIGMLVNVATGPVNILLSMTGYEVRCARILGASALVGIALHIALIPPFGILGAAAATSCMLALSNLWMLAVVMHRLGLKPSLISFSVPGAAGRE